MSSFLNALKQKSAEVTATIQNVKPTAKCSDQSVIDWIDPTGNLQSAGLLKKTPQLTITVDRVLNRNRLDVFFSEKPSNDILQALRDKGFHYRPSDKAWYHKDSEDNRIFLESKFGASFMLSGDIEDSESYEVSDNSMLNNVAVPENSVTLTSVNNEKESEEFSPHFLRFRKQTNELLEHLKCEPADLMLIAIDALHKQTFSRDS